MSGLTLRLPHVAKNGVDNTFYLFYCSIFRGRRPEKSANKDGKFATAVLKKGAPNGYNKDMIEVEAPSDALALQKQSDGNAKENEKRKGEVYG